MSDNTKNTIIAFVCTLAAQAALVLLLAIALGVHGI
ncbi:hypothetical protein LMG24235_01920 [Paraburkholderia sabiae]|jgi:hypothetical protein|nr:hypothetical protein LMG24235_01920 [Paraburkholderia sabiae]